jgi:hypothetical protein
MDGWYEINIEIEEKGGGGPLTQEVDQEASIGEPAGWSAEEGTAIGQIDRETEPGNESARVGVGVAEVEDNRRSLALTENWVRKRKQGNKHEEKEGEVGKRVRDHCGSEGVKENEWVRRRASFLLFLRISTMFCFFFFFLHVHARMMERFQLVTYVSRGMVSNQLSYSLKTFKPHLIRERGILLEK